MEDRTTEECCVYELLMKKEEGEEHLRVNVSHDLNIYKKTTASARSPSVWWSKCIEDFSSCKVDHIHTYAYKRAEVDCFVKCSDFSKLFWTCRYRPDLFVVWTAEVWWLLVCQHIMSFWGKDDGPFYGSLYHTRARAWSIRPGLFSLVLWQDMIYVAYKPWDMICYMWQLLWAQQHKFSHGIFWKVARGH